MDAPTLRERASSVPKEPGVYQFWGEESVLYIGKAVDLRSRLLSYADPRSDRIARMRRRATDLEVAVTDTETQAVLLEANLIKRHQPTYNVLLTDDKSYPLIQLTDHEAPRIEITRDPADGAHVYGPFTDVGRVETVVKGIREVFGVRGCTDTKYADRDRPCQDFEIGLCTAPCTDEIPAEEYLQDVEAVKRFLQGATGVLADPLEEMMREAATDRQFERAAHLRDRLAAVRALHGGAADAVYSRHDETARMDVLAASIQGEEATVARLRAESGKLVDRSRHHLAGPARGGAGGVLAAFIPQYYSDRELPTRLLLSDDPGDEEMATWLEEEGVQVAIPDTGRERRLVDLALQNARRRFSTREATRELAHALDIERADRIEGFDVSHAQGRAAVGSDVLFVDGEPERSGYRRKRLEDRNDDYANMRRLIAWRAERALAGRDDRPDPDLLLVDGGEGQRAAATAAVTDAGWDVPVAALAKEEAVVHSATGAHRWDASSPELHLVQRIRDEAHRFAVRYHRTVRDDVSTVLEEVPGVGEKLERRLLRRFGSVDGIRAASVGELTDVDGLGTATAQTIASHL